MQTCLNCEEEITGRFCSGCGQKGDTHRITFRNFILHDVLHGTFHIERGMLYTARQALLRPGQAALDYIAGKRKRFYNVFLLVLIVFGSVLFLRHFYDMLSFSLGEIPQQKVYPNESSKRLDELFSQRSRMIVFLFVPLAALNSFVLFRRKKLNVCEHSIIAGMLLLGILLLSALGNLLFYLTLIPHTDFIATAVNIGTPSLILLYIAYGYYNAFAGDYSLFEAVFRILLFFVLLLLEMLILLYLLIGYVTHWEFGRVTFSPFG